MSDETMKQPVSKSAMDAMSVAPPQPSGDNGAVRGSVGSQSAAAGGPADPPQGDKAEDTVFAQDDHIAERLQADPTNVQAQLDEGLAESMDGSDSVSAARPGDSGDPVPSSGFPDPG